ncbi:hypothetical protein OH77DRAFT_1476993 [Trametes cingulata]|nr:hypothetical protein OH77DRAFT_1476993 [Trametes cingulata]
MERREADFTAESPGLRGRYAGMSFKRATRNESFLAGEEQSDRATSASTSESRSRHEKDAEPGGTGCAKASSPESRSRPPSQSFVPPGIIPRIVPAGLRLPALGEDPQSRTGDLDLSPPPKLKVTCRGRPPFVCGPFEGKVAAQGYFTSLVVTSPNMDYVPEYPVERRVIDTYIDGRWGLREYSRWPQVLVPEMMHVACIPREPLPPLVPEILWHPLSPTADWQEDAETGVKTLGYIVSERRDALKEAADLIKLRLEDVRDGPEQTRQYAQFLMMVLDQAVERMLKLPSSRQTAVLVAAHVQRLCLELLGLKTYLTVVHPRLTSVVDFSVSVLPVLGAFVKDGTSAQTCMRVGLPVWFLQPITSNLKVWKIVDFQRLPPDVAGAQSGASQAGDASVLGGVVNVSGNWLRDMSLQVTRLVCDSRLPELRQADAPAVLSSAGSPIEPKRRKVDPPLAEGMHLAMPIAQAKPELPKEKKRRRKRAKGNKPMDGSTEEGSAPISGSSSRALASGPQGAPTSAAPHPSDPPQPARVYLRSPFYAIPSAWEHALRECSPLPRGTTPALYFFPPPFLLDTISPLAPAPADRPDDVLLRNDPKIARYLHNLVRIRRFCRARLFDPSMSSHPLTITEWRAALWGDYGDKEPPRADAPTAVIRRTQRRQEERNAITRLFGRVALLPAYRDDMNVTFEGRNVSLQDTINDTSVRRRLLWEAHEINFRCELVALDTLLVQRADWTERTRWERERKLSGVWGEPSSVVSVIPAALPSGTTSASLIAEHRAWPTQAARLQAFVEVMARWPEFPRRLHTALERSANWTCEELDSVSQDAVTFYVKTFVQTFRRLPVPPMYALP